MSLKQHLAEKKSVIIEKWIAAVHGTYPFGTIGFLRTQQNPFVNPVGERTKVAAEAFVSALLESGEASGAGTPETGGTADKMAAALDEFMRVRAIQDFSAEEAVGVFFALKQIISEVLEESPYLPGRPGHAEQTGPSHKSGGSGEAAEERGGKEFFARQLRERLELESNIDALAVMAFGSYARHRDLLADLRVKEFKRRHSQVIRRAERTLGEDLSEYK